MNGDRVTPDLSPNKWCVTPRAPTFEACVLKRAADCRLLGIVRGNRGALALARGELEKA